MSEAYKQAGVNKAEGEANRFLSVYEEYKKYQNVTRTRLYLETIEKVFPYIKEVTVVDEANGVTSLLPLNAFSAANGGDKK